MTGASSAIVGSVVTAGAGQIVTSTAGQLAGNQVNNLTKGNWKRQLYASMTLVGVIAAIAGKVMGNRELMAVGGALGGVSYLAYRDNVATQNLRTLDQLGDQYREQNDRREKLLEERTKQVESLEALLKERTEQLSSFRENVKVTKQDLKALTPELGEHNKNLEGLVARLREMNVQLLKRLEEAQAREGRAKGRVEKVLKALKDSQDQSAKNKEMVDRLQRAVRSFNTNSKILKEQMGEMRRLEQQCAEFDAAQKRLAATHEEMEKTLESFRQVLRDAKSLTVNSR